MEEKLIEAIRKRNLIYNLKSPDYKNVKLKNVKWKEISDEVGIPVEDAKKKWKNLRDSFIRVRRSIKGKSGQGADEDIQWKYYAGLSFLKDCIPNNITISNYEESTRLESSEEFNFDFLQTQNRSSTPSTPDFVATYTDDSTSFSNASTSSKSRKRANTNSDFLDDVFVETLHKINDCMTPNVIPEKGNEDEDELFCRTILAKIKSFPSKKIKNHAKTEILNLVCNIENNL